MILTTFIRLTRRSCAIAGGGECGKHRELFHKIKSAHSDRHAKAIAGRLSYGCRHTTEQRNQRSLGAHTCMVAPFEVEVAKQRPNMNGKEDIFKKALDEVAWTPPPQIMGGIHSRMFPDADRFRLSKTYTELREALKREEAPPPPPEPQLLDKLEFDTKYITFEDGVAVGGYSHLSLFANGTSSCTGHFHVSGSLSYDISFVWVLRSSTGSVFTFGKEGRLHGTWESGSRDYDWGDSGTNPPLAAAWADISAGSTCYWRAGANSDFGSLLDGALKVVGAAAEVVKLVGSL
jgi:hypothetical protein